MNSQQPRQYLVTSGAGTQQGCLFCIKRFRDSGLHQVYMRCADGEVKDFTLSVPYFLSESILVEPSTELADFCSHLRRVENVPELHFWEKPLGSYKPSVRSETGWIGVDLDGTLASYDGWKGVEHIGDPVETMRRRVVRWLQYGKDVRIFTARVTSRGSRTSAEASRARYVIEQWCKEFLGVQIPVTNVKDFGMVELWDDRAIRVRTNTGIIDSATR